jgi:hypothetical protein
MGDSEGVAGCGGARQQMSNFGFLFMIHFMWFISFEKCEGIVL